MSYLADNIRRMNGGFVVKIYIEQEIIEMDNNRDEIDNILNTIDKKVKESYKVFNFMKIDEVEIYNDYREYFLDNIKNIEKVEVFLVTYKELVRDILISTYDYINRTPDIIENLSDRFYKTPDKDDWSSLNDLLGGISFILNSFSSIDGDRRLKDVIENYEIWNLYAKEVYSLKEILPDFEEALSSEDNITIGDLLSYEIVPIFNNIKDKLLKLLNVEEV